MTTTAGRPPSGGPPAERPARRLPVAVRRGLVALGAGTLAAGLLLPDLLGWDRSLPFTVFAALRPVLATGVGVVAVAVLVWRRHWWPAVAGVLAVVAVAGALVLPRAVPDVATGDGTVAGPTGTDLRVLTLNTFEGAADPGVLAEVIRTERPDIVVLPESGELFRSRIAPLVPDYRSWTNVPPTAIDVRGIVVLTAPRAGEVTARRLDDGTRYPWAELRGGILGDARLVAVHVVSIVPRWIAFWPGELAMLQRWCAPPGPSDEPGPAIVVGDFNATLDHSAFRSGTAGCTDAAATTGDGLEPTWNAFWPRVVGSQIDHLLTRPGADGVAPQARATRVIDVPGSDHRAVLVDVRLP